MKKASYFILFLLLTAGVRNQVFATHLFGADLYYSYIGGDRYRVVLTLYGDCGAADPDVFAQLYSAQPQVILYNNNTLVNRNYLSPLPGTGIEVSPVCPKEILNTLCNGGTLPGIKQFVYADTVTLSGTSHKWRFVFNGELAGGFQAGRSLSMTNVTGGTVMQLEATLDNTESSNSSPFFSTIPTPFFCVNILQQYNQGAIDPNGDSLVFSLVAGVDANSAGGALNYYPPFTPTSPLATSATGFSFSAVNGQMTFTPNVLQHALVVNRVSEYKGGNLVGTSEREMTFIVRDNCDGIPPTPKINALTGATLTGSNIINICKGEPMVTFDVNIENPDGDSTLITTSALPGNSIFNIDNNNTPSPVAHFSWHTDTLAVGNYSFYMTLKNNHCPLYNTQTVAYTIRVVDYPTITVTPLTLTECIHPAAVRFDLAYGFLPRTVQVQQGGVTVKTLIDSTGSDLAGTIFDSLPAGNYTAIVSCDAICTGSVSFVIKDSGSFSLPNISESLCLGDAEKLIAVLPVKPGAVIKWFETNGTPLAGPPTINTSSTGDYAWYFIEYYNSCNSGKVSVNATVHNLPEGEVINKSTAICYGDKIYLEATGGTAYTWLPEDLIKRDTGGFFAVVLLPSTYYVKVTDEYGCADTASVTYSDIQQCCNFSYPNAFTPNNDGSNDGFRIVTYGNMLHYSLTIFNRWGQKVFYTADPHKAWDGNFAGQPCELGAYYYFLDAQCLTGPKEFHKGDITLIR
ncbi:MAG: gliding motility-associated C-terminal domain-containing protein [Taibaiella sp.]|nr:gliding motility-associated C-terminal domain-containing protein [Taibaiella sp.]